MEESDIKEYLDLVKDADEVVVASEVGLIDFTEQYERDGKKIRYFGTQESWKKWCLENSIPMVN